MSVIQNNLLMTPEGYQISRSVRLRSSASAYFNRTPAVASNRTTFTYSGWVKRGALANGYLFTAGTTSTNRFQIDFYNNTLEISMNNGSWVIDMNSSSVYRDPSAWYHVVVAVDTTQATSSNRVKAYINGVQITSWNTSTYPSLNLSTPVNSVVEHDLGISIAAGSYFDGYMTEVNFIDGQALTPSSFGETDAITGVWKPKKYAGTYGTNGFYLNFSDNSNNTAATIGKDSSGNGNNWTPNNISVTSGVTYDSMLDTPTPYADGGNGRGNYAVLNPLDNQATLSSGNLTQATGAAERGSRSSFAIPDSGLWYAEATVTSTTNAATISAAFGLASSSFSLSASAYNTAGAWDLYSSNFAYINRNGSVSGSLGYTLTAGDVIQIAVDPVNSRAWIGRNNTWYDASNGTTGSPSGGTNPTFTSLPTGLFVFVNGYNETWNANFGQRPFVYTPPTGFKALNTQNLPDATIKKGNQYFDAALSTSGGASGRTISSLNFQPDFLWDKPRSSIQDHILADAVRGLSLNLTTNKTDAETTRSTFFTGVSSNGFTIGSGDFGSGNSCVTWCWKESASAGFDIVTYTGNGTNRTIAHSLGVAPKMMIVKSRSAAGTNWNTYHASANASPATVFLNLNQTIAATADSTAWNNTAPTSSVFSVGTGAGVNTNGATYVAYLFAEVAGFSKFGSYTGNGSADGPFVFTNMKPRWVMLKRTDSTSDWLIIDTSRDTYNVATKRLYPNLSDAEGVSGNIIDSLSNGFKFRSANWNISGGTYIFAAFAENPFKHSLAQ